jgi:hypothetical protein
MLRFEELFIKMSIISDHSISALKITPISQNIMPINNKEKE